MLVAAAGPISNLLQAIAIALILRGVQAGAGPQAYVLSILQEAVIVNLMLAFFNLIPVPPLDGGNVMLGLLPPRAAAQFAQLRQFGFIILYVLMFTGIARTLIIPPTVFFMRILLP